METRTETSAKEIAIYKSAIKCIGKLGIERTNAQAVANDLKIAQSGVFYYFPRQEMLFDSLVGFIAQINHEIVSSLQVKRKAKTAHQQLMTHLEGNLIWASKHPDHVATLLVSIARTAHSKPVRETVNRLLQVGEDRIFSLLQSGIRDGEFKVAVKDVRTLAALLHKSLIGMIVSYYYSRSQARPVSYFLNLLQQEVGSLLHFTSGTTRATTSRSDIHAKSRSK